MAKGMYLGVSSKARKAKKAYIGIGGVARKIKKMYIGVGGKAKLAWSSGADGNILVLGWGSSGSGSSRTYNCNNYKASTIHYTKDSDFTLASNSPTGVKNAFYDIAYDSYNNRYIARDSSYGNYYTMNKNSNTWTNIGSASYQNSNGAMYVDQSTGIIYETYPKSDSYDNYYLAIYKVVLSSSGVTKTLVQDSCSIGSSYSYILGMTKAGSYYWVARHYENSTNLYLYYTTNPSSAFTAAGSFGVSTLYGNVSGGSGVYSPTDRITPIYYDKDGYYVGFMWGHSYYSNSQHIGEGVFKSDSPSTLSSGRILDRCVSGYYDYNPLCYLKKKIFFRHTAYEDIYYTVVNSSTSSITFTKISAIGQNTLAPPNYPTSLMVDEEYLYFIGYSTSYTPARKNFVRINPDDVENPLILTGTPIFTNGYISNLGICTTDKITR